jgi:hypothetical protein
MINYVSSNSICSFNFGLPGIKFRKAKLAICQISLTSATGSLANFFVWATRSKVEHVLLFFLSQEKKDKNLLDDLQSAAH